MTPSSHDDEPVETILTGEGVYVVYEEAPAVTEGAPPSDRVSWWKCEGCGAELPHEIKGTHLCP